MTPSIHLAMVIWHETYKSKTFVVGNTFYLTVISNGSVLVFTLLSCLYPLKVQAHCLGHTPQLAGCLGQKVVVFPSC